MGAENLLHDLGVIPVTSSDAQGMGRAGENWRSTFGLAGALTSLQRHTGAEPDLTDDNARILRYLAKLTINPARVHGLDQYVGSLEPGKIADIVLWSGDPLEVTTVAEDVIIAGRAIEMRSRQTELRERYLAARAG